MPASHPRPTRPRKASSISQPRSSIAATKVQVTINVYDLLPPGRLSTLLWTLGSGLLHSGVVINGREYAYGGHNSRGVTGVYWTKPRQEPPGGTFRSDVLHGFTFRTEREIEAIIKEVSDTFLGPSYNLLTHNCNHFTSALCEALTSKAAPGWLNRAASIGLALPCVVPREWISPPDADTADGELLAGEAGVAEDDENEDDDDDDEDDDEHADERAAMLDGDRRRRRRREEQARRRPGGIEAETRTGTRTKSQTQTREEGSVAGGRRIVERDVTPPPRLVAVQDSGGHQLPVSERAPVLTATLPRRTSASVYFGT